MQTMTLGSDLIQGLSEGRLGGAVWHGRHHLESGTIRLQTPDGKVSVQMTVREVRHKPFSEIDDREARASGEEDREALWQVMSANYAGMSRSDDVTVAFLE